MITNKRFTLYDRSASTGLDYAINRSYDPLQGRFTQVDPIKMGDSSLSNPQSFNLYTYCQNDPINHTDPSGLGFFSFLKKLFKWVMIAITVIVAVVSVFGIGAVTAGLSAVFGSAFGGALGSAIGFIAQIPAMIGGGIFGGTAGSIASAMGFATDTLVGAAVVNSLNALLGWSVLAAAKATVSALANHFDKVQLKGKKKTDWKVSIARIRVLLNDSKSVCYKFLKSKGIDTHQIVKGLSGQRPYDGFKSTNKEDLGAVGASPKELFDAYKAAGIPVDAVTAPSGNIYYGNVRGGMRTSVVLHENIHKSLGIRDDDELGQKLGVWDKQGEQDSGKINDTLEANGCK